MQGGFRSLVNPPTRLGDIDLESTRAERHRIHAKCRRRQFAEWALRHGGSLVEVNELVFVVERQQDDTEPAEASAMPR